MKNGYFYKLFSRKDYSLAGGILLGAGLTAGGYALGNYLYNRNIRSKAKKKSRQIMDRAQARSAQVSRYFDARKQKLDQLYAMQDEAMKRGDNAAVANILHQISAIVTNKK